MLRFREIFLTWKISGESWRLPKEDFDQVWKPNSKPQPWLISQKETCHRWWPITLWRIKSSQAPVHLLRLCQALLKAPRRRPPRKGFGDKCLSMFCKYNRDQCQLLSDAFTCFSYLSRAHHTHPTKLYNCTAPSFDLFSEKQFQGFTAT